MSDIPLEWPRTLRNAAGWFAWASYPPGCLFWFGVHPFVARWRRAGRTPYVLYVTACYAAWFAPAWAFRRELLGPTLGLGASGLTAGVVLLATGIAIAVWRTRTLPTSWLFGIGEVTGGRLLTEGPYRFVRHPRYVEAMCELAGLVLISDRLGVASLLVICPAILAGVVVLEERELRDRFGAAYDRYAARTPRFLPRISERRGGTDSSGAGDGADRHGHDEGG